MYCTPCIGGRSYCTYEGFVSHAPVKSESMATRFPLGMAPRLRSRQRYGAANGEAAEEDAPKDAIPCHGGL